MKIAKVLRDYPIPGVRNFWFCAGESLTQQHGPGCAFSNKGDFEIEALEVERHSHFFEISEVPDGPWKPKTGEVYWTIVADATPHPTNNSGTYDQKVIATGNCFRTRVEAEAKIPEVKRALAGKTLKDVLEGCRKELRTMTPSTSGFSYDSRITDIFTIILTAWEQNK